MPSWHSCGDGIGPEDIHRRNRFRGEAMRGKYTAKIDRQRSPNVIETNSRMIFEH